MHTQRGFTLVEILVVVSLIAILSGIIYASFSGARDQAKNRALQTELKEIQLAAEVYRAQNGQYPPATSGSGCYSLSGGVERAQNSNGACANWQYVGILTPDFISELPESRDSSNPNCALVYEVAQDGSWYKLAAERCLSGLTSAAEGIGEDQEFSRCPSSCGSCGGSTYNATYVASTDFYESIAVYSFGGECQ